MGEGLPHRGVSGGSAPPWQVQREYEPYPAALSLTHPHPCGIDHAGNPPKRNCFGLTFSLRQEMLRSKVNHIQAYR